MEDKAGKPHKQSLAIALSVARRGKKRMADGGPVPSKWEQFQKGYNAHEGHGSSSPSEADAKPKPQASPTPMAHGGDVDEHYSSIADAILAKKRKMAMGGEVLSAKYEARPMPDNEYNDSEEVSRNSSAKPPHNDSWTDRSTVEDAQRPSPHKLSQPEGGGSEMLHEDEEDLEESAAPGNPGSQPKEAYDEEGADREGPKVHPMPRFADGGMIDEDNMSISDAIRRRRREQDAPSGDGMVDLEENSEEMPNQYDEIDGKVAHEEQYDDSQLSSQPEDSNEHGGMSEEDEHDLDLISSIRRKMKKAPR